jgi:hypothetical protein
MKNYPKALYLKVLALFLMETVGYFSGIMIVRILPDLVGLGVTKE